MAKFNTKVNIPSLEEILDDLRIHPEKHGAEEMSLALYVSLRPVSTKEVDDNNVEIPSIPTVARKDSTIRDPRTKKSLNFRHHGSEAEMCGGGKHRQDLDVNNTLEVRRKRADELSVEKSEKFSADENVEIDDTITYTREDYIFSIENVVFKKNMTKILEILEESERLKYIGITPELEHIKEIVKEEIKKREY